MQHGHAAAPALPLHVRGNHVQVIPSFAIAGCCCKCRFHVSLFCVCSCGPFVQLITTLGLADTNCTNYPTAGSRSLSFLVPSRCSHAGSSVLGCCALPGCYEPASSFTPTVPVPKCEKYTGATHNLLSCVSEPPHLNSRRWCGCVAGSVCASVLPFDVYIPVGYTQQQLDLASSPSAPMLLVRVVMLAGMVLLSLIVVTVAD